MHDPRQNELAKQHLKTHKPYGVAWKEVLLITDWLEETTVKHDEKKKERNGENGLVAAPQQIDVALSVRESGANNQAKIIQCAADITPTVNAQIEHGIINVQVQLRRR